MSAVRAISRITSAEFAVWIFIAILLAVYAVAPALIYTFSAPSPYMLKLAALTTVTAAFIAIGFLVPVLDFQFGPRAWRIPIPRQVFHAVIWIAFAIFCVVAFSTAEGIPIVQALQGNATEAELNVLREKFLKAREGWQISLLYISTIFTGTLLPYSMSSLFCDRSRYRFLALFALFAYVESHLQKALFFTIVAPLAYLVAQRKIWNYWGLIALLLASIGLMYINGRLAWDEHSAEREAALFEWRAELAKELATSSDEVPSDNAPEETSKGGSEEQSGSSPAIPPDGSSESEATVRTPWLPPLFFTSKFTPITTSERLLYRALSVPIITASDALALHDEKYAGEPLLGATSTFLAAVFGMERIPFERELHSFQWGVAGTGASNSVYVTEAFVNFGWAGVVVFSLFIGQAFRWFWKSEDYAFKAMWPLFAFYIIQAGMIPTLLSNGYALLFFVGLFGRLQQVRNVRVHIPRP